MRFVRPILSLLVLASLTAGCSTYYRITDTQTRRTYYTTEFAREPNNVRFKDQFGQEVTVPAGTARVESVSADEYSAATRREALLSGRAA